MISDLSDITSLLALFLTLFITNIQYSIIVLLLFLLFWFLLYPEKVEKCSALIYKALTILGLKFSQKYIAHDIQAKINSKAKRINKEYNGILPYTMKVKWVDLEDVESEVKNGNVVVIMKDYKNQSINLARAAIAYTCKGLIPKAREYVHPPLMKAIDYNIARKLVIDNTGAVQYLSSLFEEESKKKPEIKEWITKIKPVDAQGYLTRIILSEYQKVGEELYPITPNMEIRNETADFTDLVYRLVTKEKDVDINPTYNGDYIKVAIVPIARLETMSIEPHMNFIRKSLDEGEIKYFHIVAAGKNVHFAKLIVDRAEKELGLIKIKEEKYKGTYRGVKMTLFHAVLEKPSPKTPEHIIK